ncbi:MAG TPA: LacI family DNA-binding transcriptional regulator [Armatimonadota bacterium]|nr:LacI family DNA-binding transcriptional regulator [Armatimonadota bacterium]
MTNDANKNVTMRDIARQCQVNQATVSRAMNHDPRVKLATAERIRATAATMGYDPTLQIAARRLSMQKSGVMPASHLIGVSMSNDFAEVPYFSKLFSGILDQSETNHATLLMANSKNPTTPDAMVRLHDLYMYHGVRGFIVIGSYFRRIPITKTIMSDNSLGDPTLVFLIESIPGYASVVTDDCQGAYLATKHLLDLGHRHITQLTYKAFGQRQEQRLIGVRKALMEYKLDPNDSLDLCPIPALSWFVPSNLIPWLSDKPRMRRECAPLATALRRHQSTALLTLNDASALHAWYGLQHQGWRIPEDISLIGFDDTDNYMSIQGQGLLTTVHLPLYEAGKSAVKLVQAIQQGTATSKTQIMLPATLTIRQSTMPPKNL